MSAHPVGLRVDWGGDCWQIRILLNPPRLWASNPAPTPRCLACLHVCVRAAPATYMLRPARTPTNPFPTTTNNNSQDVDWEFAERAADDDLDQGASEEEGVLEDDVGYRKHLGEL